MRAVRNQPVGSPAMTVGQLISELCRYPDHATITFLCPLQHQKLHLLRIESSSKGAVDFAFDLTPKAASVS
jgi:hypothetical protein